jgi:hypothetical protein
MGDIADQHREEFYIALKRNEHKTKGRVSMAKNDLKQKLKEVKGRAFTTPIGRLAFPSLDEPKAYQEGAKAYYQTTILFDKETDLTAMRKEIKLAAAEVFGKDTKKWPAIEMPWRDGDEKEDLTGYPGTWYVSAKSLRKVKVVDGQKQPVDAADQDEVFGGRYAVLAVRAKLVSSGTKLFVTLYLQAVQVRTVKGEKGESYSSGVDTDAAFESEEDEDISSDFSDDDNDELTL